jgi:hypothetical protein
MDFKKLKKQTLSVEKLTEAIAKTQGGFDKDERFWSPEVDKAGNGYAVIRFLPAPAVDGDDGLPWVKLFTHAFQGPGGWYIENSLTTLDKDDPVSEYNTKLWNSGIESNKEIARKQKRKLVYISNIYVVSDPKHPENEGKVFLFKYGKKIFDKLKDAASPPEEFADEKPIQPFDLWSGANFKLKIRKVEGYRNYDKSEFDTPAPLLGGDDKKLEAVYNAETSLLEHIAETEFKDYATLKRKLDKVLGIDTSSGSTPLDSPEPAEVSEARQVVKARAETAVVEDDDSESYFEELAKGE